jgi:HTH-type transcriptional regulator / antitoxin HigA
MRMVMAETDTPEGERLEVLVTLVEAYENRHFPLDLPDPVEAIKFRMDQMGLCPRIWNP